MNKPIDPFLQQGGNGLLDAPVSQEKSGAADILDVGVAGLLTEPSAKLDYYSEQMGIPRENFGVVDGQIVYQKPSGDLQAVEAGFGRQVASGVGAAVPAATGLAGMLIGAPAGPIGMAGGGALGAAAGQSLREAFTGTATTLRGMGRIGFEGAIDLTAGVFSNLIGKGVSQALATDAAKNFRQFMKQTGGDVATSLSKSLADVNKRYGTNIILSPAELTKDVELLGIQMALGSDPRTGQTMADFFAGRGKEAAKATEGFIEEVAPSYAGRDIAGEELVEVAGEAIALTRAERAAAAAPMYDNAFNIRTVDDAGDEVVEQQFVNITEFDEALKKLVIEYPMLKNQLAKVKNAYKTQTDLPLEFVQNNIKEALDDVISAMGKKPKAKMKAAELQRSLLASLDEQVPEYALARQTWGDLSDPVTSAQAGSLGRIAKKTERDFYDAGRAFLTKDSPASIRRAKAQIMKVEGGGAKWNAALRGALEDLWETSTKQYKSQVGRPEMLEGSAAVDFWAQVKGNKKQLTRFQAAMTPSQFDAFNKLLDVLEATGRAINFNSTTLAQQVGRDNLKKIGKSYGAASVMPFVTAPYRVFGASSDAIQQGIVNRNLDVLADAITRPDAVEQLAKLQKGKAGWVSPRNVNILSRVLIGTARVTGAAMIGEKDVPIAQPEQVMERAGNPSGRIDPFLQ